MIEVDFFPSRHPLWQTYLESPPGGVKYLVRSGTFGTMYLALSSILRTKRLAHFCNGVKLAPWRKWVADMESVKVFFKSYEELEDEKKIQSAIERVMTGQCAALLPLTWAAKRTINRYLSIRDVDIKVIYPTFYSKYGSRYFEKRDIILFVGGSWRDLSFEAKGGREVCEAWLRIHKDFPDYQFVVLSEPAPRYVARLKEVKAFIGSLPRKTLLTEIFPRAKVIVLPSMMDTVGYSVIEAMNYGVVPVVSDHFAMPELVGDAGIILKAPTGLWRSDGSHNPRFHEELSEGPFHELAERIADSLHMLLSDDSLWQNLSNKAVKRMRSPPFSVESRNQSILEVYQKALQ
jgi:glycosyltransferase involved in cell wall biosynthesis